MNKKKLAILALSMGSGGAEKVISLLLKELVKEYEVSLFLFFGKFHYTLPPQVKIVVVSGRQSNSLWQRIVLFPQVFLSYLRFLEKENINVSVSFLFRPNLINGLIKIFRKKTKVILSERNYPSKEYKTSKLRYLISKTGIKFLYNRADLLFSNSFFINKDLTENFKVYVPLKVIYNPIEQPQKFIQGQNKRNSLVSVGRFEPVKNHKMIFETIKNTSDFTLTIIGDGRLKNTYIDYIEENKIGNKVNLPGVSNSVLTDLLEYSIFVLSSDSEGFPNSLLEAMSVGLPVVSTNCLSGPLELLNCGNSVDIPKGEFVMGQFGLLINVGDSEGLTKAVTFLSKDEKAYYSYSILSKQRASDFFLPKIYKTFKETIEDK